MGHRVGRLRPGHRIRRRFERPDNAVDSDRGGEGGTYETNLFPESVATQKEKPSQAKPSGTIRPPSALPIISGSPHPTGRFPPDKLRSPYPRRVWYKKSGGCDLRGGGFGRPVQENAAGTRRLGARPHP